MLMQDWGIKATAEGRKTVTRRLGGLQEINKDPDKWHFVTSAIRDILPVHVGDCLLENREGQQSWVKPRYHVGQTIYIKEAWCESFDGSKIHYKLDGGESPGPKGFWRSPLFMPAWAARRFVKILAVTAGRVQEITEAEAKKEGVGYGFQMNAGWPDYQHIENGICSLTQDTAIASFSTLWDSINARPKPVYIRQGGQRIISHYVSYPWEDGTRVEEHRGKKLYICGNPWVFRNEYELVKPD